MAGLTVAGRILAKKTASQVVLEHEAVHVEQQRRDGWWRFLWRYATSPAWRVRYESEAYRVQLRAGYDPEALARQLAGPLYAWPCSVEEARAALEAAR